jgi:hypothetical protein
MSPPLLKLTAALSSWPHASPTLSPTSARFTRACELVTLSKIDVATHARPHAPVPSPLGLVGTPGLWLHAPIDISSLWNPLVVRTPRPALDLQGLAIKWFTPPSLLEEELADVDHPTPCFCARPCNPVVHIAHLFYPRRHPRLFELHVPCCSHSMSRTLSVGIPLPLECGTCS